MSRDEDPLACAPTGVLYLGSRIRQLRQAQGLSREQLGDLVGRHPASLSKIETNAAKPSELLLTRLAAVFNVPVDEWKSYPLHPRIDKAGQRPTRPAAARPQLQTQLEAMQHTVAEIAMLRLEVQRLTALLDQRVPKPVAGESSTDKARMLPSQDVVLAESMSRALGDTGVEAAYARIRDDTALASGGSDAGKLTVHPPLTIAGLIARAPHHSYPLGDLGAHAALEEADSRRGMRFLWQNGLGEITIPREVDAERVEIGNATLPPDPDREKRVAAILGHRHARQQQVIEHLRSGPAQQVIDVCPLSALSHLARTGESYQGEALSRLGYPSASSAGVRTHLEHVLYFLENFPNYHLALVTAEHDVALCHPFWLVAVGHIAFCELTVFDAMAHEEVAVIRQTSDAVIVDHISKAAQYHWHELRVTRNAHRCWVKEQVRQHIALVAVDERRHARVLQARSSRRLMAE